MLSSTRRLPKIILFCLENRKENPFLEDAGLDFFLFFAIKSSYTLGKNTNLPRKRGN
jgi:hypothetical protein